SRRNHQGRPLHARGSGLPRRLRVRAGDPGRQLHLPGEGQQGVARAADQGLARATRHEDGAGSPAGGRAPDRRRGGPLMAGPKLLSADWDKPESWTLATYRAGGGYQALPKALKMQPQQIVDEVLKSNL